MDNHDKYAALLDAFIDGELSAQEAGEVREHLTYCADCRGYVSDALAMREAFPDIEETIVPDGFAESVLAALPPRQIAWRTQWKKFVLPLAACLTIVLLARGLPKSVDTTGSTVTSDTDAGGGMPMLSVAYNPDDASADDSSDNADTVDYRFDDADTMPPQAPEANIPTESAAASKKSAGEQRSAAGAIPEQGEAAGAIPEQGEAAKPIPEEPEPEEALDGVSFSAGSVETNTVTESAFDEDTAPDTVNAPAVPDSNASGDSVPEDAEAELYAMLSVWTVPIEAASLLEPYARAVEMKSGVWYALTAEQFDALSLKLADKNMEAVPGDDTPPTTLSDAEYYVFVPTP